MSAVKRRQPVLTPCDRAPKLFVAGAFVVLATGATPKHRVGGVWRSGRGQRAGHRHRRGIPGTPACAGAGSVRSLYSQPTEPVSRRRTVNPGARRQEVLSYLTERRRGLGLEPSDESISRPVRVRGSRSVS